MNKGIETHNLKLETRTKTACGFHSWSGKVSSFKPWGSNARAFTLVELMVVIAIIGILTGIVSASLSTSKAKSRDQQRVADISQIQLALAYHLDQYSAYPKTLTDTTLKQFLPYLPVDPIPSRTYQYVSLGTDCNFPVSYHLGATLELKSGVLDADKDFNSLSVPPTQKCAGDGFNGADSENNLIYDVRP